MHWPWHVHFCVEHPKKRTTVERMHIDMPSIAKTKHNCMIYHEKAKISYQPTSCSSGNGFLIWAEAIYCQKCDNDYQSLSLI